MVDSFIRSVIFDVICLLVVWIPDLVINLLAEPFERGFYCDDESIRYPYKENTITDVVLFSYSIGLPVISIICVEIVLGYTRSNTKRLSRQDSGQAVHVSFVRISDVLSEIIRSIAFFLFGAGCSQLTTDVGKFSSGKLRPSFLAVCQPEGLHETLCPESIRTPTYIDNYNCTGADNYILTDSRLSFPSGHASISTYTMLFLVFYLQRKMKWSRSKFLRSTIQFAALLLAWYTGLSRITDYKHHWGDVTAGYIIGTLSASLTVLYVSSLFNKKSLMYRGDVRPTLTPKEDIELPTISTQV